ncbi:MAG: DUF1456 family protein [Desulforhopalus sp.]|nr:DUF1456 family protein [Desulforhopalus sp.]
MNNNEILRSVRYILSLGDEKMIALFALGGCRVSREQVCNWLKKDDDPAQQNCTDGELARFLNGLITKKRGTKEGPPVEVENRLNNNIVLRKLKIAFNLQSVDMLQIMAQAGLPISDHELSAFFRKADHKHYRPCKDQVLRNFLKGLQMRFRPHDPGQAKQAGQSSTYLPPGEHDEEDRVPPTVWQKRKN